MLAEALNKRGILLRGTNMTLAEFLHNFICVKKKAPKRFKLEQVQRMVEEEARSRRADSKNLLVSLSVKVEKGHGWFIFCE